MKTLLVGLTLLISTSVFASNGSNDIDQIDLSKVACYQVNYNNHKCTKPEHLDWSESTNNPIETLKWGALVSSICSNSITLEEIDGGARKVTLSARGETGNLHAFNVVTLGLNYVLQEQVAIIKAKESLNEKIEALDSIIPSCDGKSFSDLDEY